MFGSSSAEPSHIKAVRFTHLFSASTEREFTNQLLWFQPVQLSRLKMRSERTAPLSNMEVKTKHGKNYTVKETDTRETTWQLNKLGTWAKYYQDLRKAYLQSKHHRYLSFRSPEDWEFCLKYKTARSLLSETVSTNWRRHAKSQVSKSDAVKIFNQGNIYASTVLM